MKILYIDCGMGAAGDMLTASLLGVLSPDERAKALDALNAAGIPGVRYVLEDSVKCGIRGLSVRVIINGLEEGSDDHDHDHHDHDHHDHDHHDHDHDHHDHDHHDHDHHDHDHHDHDHHHHHHHQHHSMDEINGIISALNLPEEVKQHAAGVYGLLAGAESEAHGIPVSEVHFHEVGMMDAVADITAVSYLVYLLKPDLIMASPVTTGSGTVRCAHGILPVPAPATANLLRGIPSRSGDKNGELCTPTGAALIRHFAAKYGAQPAMTADAYGYGMGKKDFEWANCVRTTLGNAFEESCENTEEEDVIIFSCNLDDMTAEEIAYAEEKLLASGALDVWSCAAGMKKSRIGTVLHVLCTPDAREQLLSCMFRNTTTLGIREQQIRRHVLTRRTVTEETPYGTVRKKVSAGYGAETEKYEYEDLSELADRSGMTLLELKRAVSGGSQPRSDEDGADAPSAARQER